MGTVMRIAVNARPFEWCLLRDHRDGAAGGKTHVRRKGSQENSPTRGSRPPMPDISDDSCSDVVTERHCRLPPPLAMYEDRAALPVDIIEI